MLHDENRNGEIHRHFPEYVLQGGRTARRCSDQNDFRIPVVGQYFRRKDFSFLCSVDTQLVHVDTLDITVLLEDYLETTTEHLDAVESVPLLPDFA